LSHHHKSDPFQSLAIGIVTVSTSRTLATDTSGAWMGRQAQKEGHRVVSHAVVPDETGPIREHVLGLLSETAPDAVLVTGGTGISDADVTIEALRPLFTKELAAFGTLFATLSFDQVDSAAILSRATAGRIRRTLVFCLPGSLKACKLACMELIFPELGHLVRHVTRG